MIGYPGSLLLHGLLPRYPASLESVWPIVDAGLRGRGGAGAVVERVLSW